MFSSLNLKTTYNYLISNLGFTDCLHVATHSGNIDKVRELLDEGIVVDALDGNKTALHIAVEKRFVSIAKLLLEKGANPDAQSVKQKSALHIAAEKGFVEIGELLLEYRANPAIVDWLDLTPLYYAIKAKNVDFTRLILMKNKGLAKVNCQVHRNYDRKEKTPLDIAAEEGSMEIVRLLESFGVVVNQEIIDQTNAIISRGEAVHWCQQRGHDFKRYTDGRSYCSGQAIDLDYALWEYVNKGNGIVVEGLLQFKYYQNLLNTACFDLSLDENMEKNFPGLYKKLKNNFYEDSSLSHYREVPNTNKAPVLVQAVINGDVGMTQLLVRLGADTDIAVNSLTLNKIAKQLGNMEIRNILKDSNVDEKNVNNPLSRR